MNEDQKQNTIEDSETDNKCDFVFISREIEHMKWISKYLEAALTIPEMGKYFNLHIYVTVKPESNNLASFLFWRALTLYNKRIETERLFKANLFINLGRPNLEKLIDKLCGEKEIKKHYMYAWGPKEVTEKLEKVCLNRSQSKDKKIIFNYEIF